MGQDDDDATLVRRCLAGDARGERVLVERYRDAVWRLAKGATGDPDAALDIVQETFVRAFKGLGSLQNDAQLSTWLFGIAKNVAREALRSRRRNKNFVELEHLTNAEFKAAGLRPDPWGQAETRGSRKEEKVPRPPAPTNGVQGAQRQIRASVRQQRQQLPPLDQP